MNSRAFSTNQVSIFMNAFGQKIVNVNNGAEFLGIVESRPIYIDGADGLIASTDTYFSTYHDSPIEQGDYVILDINDPNGTNVQTYIIYNIESDLSGVINCYFRMP